MTQEIVVLRCKECATFQTHISKKSIKFSCKLCGTKQSISRIYGKGTGAECRRTCQHLNSVLDHEADSDDVDREVERCEDEQHQLKMQQLQSRQGQHSDSDEMLTPHADDCESDTAADSQTSDSPLSDSLPDEGFEEKNLIRDQEQLKPSSTTLSAGVASSAAATSSSGCDPASHLAGDPADSPPVAKKSKFSIL